ncbi:hypothetical protein [Actinokineospora sp. NBRC 105648]|uniref:hypothetical protein n=1 Tax=Actinokineospora sp. NBRC 105648 TaxID=3032206 RepID=UPI0024A4BD31|nr:hypothetical protein [Actinokineospora sp. NBRC 105648]GLZ38153.1 hypothetical protein Acsp05_17770 [Actinokineospora sp. NBRC 105648]
MRPESTTQPVIRRTCRKAAAGHGDGEVTAGDSANSVRTLTESPAPPTGRARRVGSSPQVAEQTRERRRALEQDEDELQHYEDSLDHEDGTAPARVLVQGDHLSEESVITGKRGSGTRASSAPVPPPRRNRPRWESAILDTMFDGPLDDIAINVRTKSRKTSTGLDLANSPVTRAFLEGGRRLAENELLGNVHAQRRSFHPLGTLTKSRVIDEAKVIFREARGDQRVARALYGAVPEAERPTTKPSVGTLRDRWDVLPLFLGDLVRYVLRDRYSLTDGMLDESTRAELCETADFSAAVDQVAYEDMRVLYANETSARFQYLMTGLADFHDEIRVALAGVYEHSFEYWRGVYAEIIETRGVSLRPGISLDELTMMLTGMAQGLSLRHIGAAGVKVVDNQNRSSVLGKATQILIAGAIDPGDGREVADVVDELMAVRTPPSTDRGKLARFRPLVRRSKNQRW